MHNDTYIDGDSTNDIETQTYKAYNYCIYLLGRRYYSVKEVKDKLRNKEYPEEISEAIISLLEEKGLLDDYRFATAWVRDRNNFKPRGKALLARELIARGIDGKTIGRVIEEEFPDDDIELAHRAIASKIRVYKTLDRTTGVRRARNFLIRRGFNYETVRIAVSAIFDEDSR